MQQILRKLTPQLTASVINAGALIGLPLLKAGVIPQARLSRKTLYIVPALINIGERVNVAWQSW